MVLLIYFHFSSTNIRARKARLILQFCFFRTESHVFTSLLHHRYIESLPTYFIRLFSINHYFSFHCI